MINNLKNDVERHHFQNTSLSCLGINLEKSLKHCFFYTFFKCATDTATKSTFTQSLNHTNLNCRSHGPLEQPQPAVPYTKVQNSIERDSTNYAPLSGYSTISNVLQIGVDSLRRKLFSNFCDQNLFSNPYCLSRQIPTDKIDQI